MTVWYNTAESIGNGVAPTPANSGGSGSTAWDDVAVTGGATIVVDTSQHRASGSTRSYKVTGASGGTAILSKNLTSLAAASVEPNFYFTAFPSVAIAVAQIRDPQGHVLTLVINSTGHWTVQDALGNSVSPGGTSTNTIPLNTWFRLGGGAAQGTSTSNGTVQAASSTGDSGTRIETLPTSGANSQNAGTTPLTIVRFGLCSATTYTGSFWIDDPQWSDSATMPGPFGGVQAVADPPAMGTPVAGQTQVTVPFTPPGYTGTSSITSYTITASTGGTGSGASSPITVTGLTGGVPVTFTGHSTNTAGNSKESLPSSSVTPTSAATTNNGGLYLLTADAGWVLAQLDLTVGGPGQAPSLITLSDSGRGVDTIHASSSAYDTNGVALSGFTIVPTSAHTTDSILAGFTLTTNTNVVLDDACISVRDHTGLPDDAHLDFTHTGTVTLNSASQSFSSSRTFTLADTYTAYVSYEIAGVWTHMPPQITFTIATPVTPPSGTNPLGTIGFRSGLNRMSGVWGVDRAGSGASYTTSAKIPESAPPTGRGRLVDITMASQYSNGAWGDLTGMQVLDFLDDYGNQTNGPIPVIMLPAFPPSGASWAGAAAGTYDADYQAIGAAIASKRGTKKTVIRFAWECNGDWYPWNILAAGASTFIAGWQRAVTQIRAGAGANAANIIFTYSLSNLDDKGQGDPLTVTYPGDAYVDCIGTDVYDDDNLVTTSATTPGKAAIMQRVYDFAKAHGKFWSVDEWGVNNTSGGGKGGDNPLYIKAMIAFFTSHADILLLESYFQDDDLGNVNSSLFSPDVNNNPNSKAAYLALMA